MLNNPALPERDGRNAYRAAAGFAILAALLLHVLLVWLLFQQKVTVAPPRPIPVFVVRPQIAAAPKPAVKTVAIPKPVHVRVPVVVRAKPQARPLEHKMVRRLVTPPRLIPPVMHFNHSTDDGLGLDLGAPSAGTSNGQALLGGFDDSVKQRIEAAKTYPPGLQTKHGLKFWDECVVSYRVTIDRDGQLLNYQLFGCGNPFLDAAARAAILLASPYPLPPNFGGNRFDVYGSLVFRQK